MPKRGGGRGRNTDHFEHDDRGFGGGSNNTRKVSFKPVGNRGKFRKGGFDNYAGKLLLDDDVDMGANFRQRQGNEAFRGRGGRMNTQRTKSSHVVKKFIVGLLPWYQVIIPYGAKHDKDVVLKALLSYISPDIFIPHYYKINGNAAVFYVDDAKAAEKLFYADRKITMQDGFRMVIIVRNAVPNINVDAEMKEKMKLAMAKRYNAATKALDLTKFHADPDLLDIFCALFRPAIMLAAIDIIAENIPEIEAINLNDNKLHGLEHMKIMATKLKQLKILYLGENRITHLGSLEAFKALQLQELFLKGNPLVNKYQDQDIYVSDIRKKFPKLLKLDGVDLPPPIGFDVEKESELPASQQSFLVDPAGQDLIREFLTQYYNIYDSETRQPLLEAYHENAVFSLSANYLSNDNRNSSNTRLNAYLSSSRNILRITERESRKKYLRIGKLQVVSFLSDLPKTLHDLMGFTVDLTVFTPTMTLLTVNGVFKETNVSGSPTRSFQRTFLIVPNASGGFCIMNDMIYITNTTKEQEEKAFTAGVPVAAPTPAAVVGSIASGSQDDAQKMQAVAMLSQQTGMNQHWTINCLQETNWDLQRALFIFNQLQSEGKIPPEAFVK